jgi:molybdopterin synthase catalytic subunit
VTLVTVSVRLFAILRQHAGRDRLDLELAEGATVADALAALAREPGLGETLKATNVGVAVNRQYARADAPLAAGDELALIPPLSGGADAQVRSTRAAVHVRLTDEPLSIDALAQAVGRPQAGAIVVFEGTTRDVQSLDYEAYEEMAQERIEAILRECAERHRLCAAAAEHRLGNVPLGEASVVVAVSAAHREEAFAGAREAIDRIKAQAPVWKREVEADGSARWVAGVPAPRAEMWDDRSERTR